MSELILIPLTIIVIVSGFAVSEWIRLRALQKARKSFEDTLKESFSLSLDKELNDCFKGHCKNCNCKTLKNHEN